MSETFILEANRNNATSAKSNAEYNCKLAKPITVNPGDQVNLRMASIDSQNVSDDTIIVTSDTKLSMNFSIYDVDYTTNAKVEAISGTAWPSQTYNYYAAYNTKRTETVNSVVINVVGYVAPYFRPPPYSRNNGGSFVVNQSSGIGTSNDWFKINCRYIDTEGQIQEITVTGTNAASGDPDLNWHATGSTITALVDVDAIVNTFEVVSYSGTWLGKAKAPNFGAAPAGGPAKENESDVPVKNSQFSVNKINTTPGAQTGYDLDLKTTSVTVPQGSYDPKGFAVYLTQLFNSSKGLLPATAGQNGVYAPQNEFLQRTDAEANTDMIFRRVDFSGNEQDISFNDSNSYRYNQPVFVGATQFALEYGSAGEVFSLNYAHMPMVNIDEPTKQTVAIHYTGSVGTSDLRYHQVNQASGIVIHDLQPAAFWRDKIGLYEQVLVPLSQTSTGLNYYRETDMVDRITYGYASLDSFILTDPAHAKGTDFRIMDPIPFANNTAGDPIVFIDVTGQTRSLIGNSTATNTTGGYYFIEVLGLPSRRGGYVDNTEDNPKITAIVSKQYSSNNVITGFADAGIPYTHVGNPTMISDLRVRILDEFKNVVTDLGSNNTVFIELQKQGPIQLKQEQAEIKNPKEAKTQNELQGV